MPLQVGYPTRLPAGSIREIVFTLREMYLRRLSLSLWAHHTAIPSLLHFGGSWQFEFEAI